MQTFTETITASKYPEYAGYRSRTSRLLPWFPLDRSTSDRATTDRTEGPQPGRSAPVDEGGE